VTGSMTSWDDAKRRRWSISTRVYILCAMSVIQLGLMKDLREYLEGVCGRSVLLRLCRTMESCANGIRSDYFVGKGIYAWKRMEATVPQRDLTNGMPV
jgi:hypothetical protein